jgi:DNA segregation ATPase FtsK/SpoIIIE, S-DNA-T family
VQLNLRLVRSSGPAEHLVVMGEPESPLSAVVGALEAIQPGPLTVRGHVLPADGQLGESELRDGDIVASGRGSGSPAPEGDGALWELAVVGGPGAGSRWRLGEGEYVAGRGEDADLVLPHSTVSPRHFRLLVEEGTGVGIEDLGSRNKTGLDGVVVNKLTLVRPGQLIQAGACLLEVRDLPVADADVSTDGEGGLGFNRPARIRRARKETRVAFPAPPSEREAHPFPWIQVTAPLVLAGGAAMVMGEPRMLLFAVMSPVMAGSSFMSNRKRTTKRAEKESGRYETELAAAEAALAQACATQTAEARRDFPDPAALAATATGPGRRLWERREGDVDALTMRVGLADLPADVVVTRRGGEESEPPKLSWVPVTVDLGAAGVMGVAGPTPERRAVARWLVAQLAATRSPRELQVVVLTDADAGDDWEWVRWLPHVRVPEQQAPLALIGNDRTSREDRLRELVKLLDARQDAAKEQHGAGVFSPAVVVVLDGVRSMRSLPGVPRLLREGPAVGIYSIGLDSDATRLAEEGKAEVLVDGSGPLGELRVDGVPPVPNVLLDQVSPAWADEVARGLAPLRDVGSEEESVIPDAVRFVDLARITLDNVDEVVARWTLGGRTTEALVGASVDGPFSIDLKRDGPHGLVAGTTGSGKSEFLQTLVVSLALGNRPDAMNFVLVDYKGASAFGECERLPHTVGMVTNLDGHLTERALASLDAELQRREHVLRQLGAADVDTAWERNPERAAREGLARLVIVIDEFAELVHELPEFVTGLIRIARVGRSLGVHLILATQRPAGVVSSEMRANTGLRVALRMEDKHDSTEVLESPDAAAILRSTPGRGYVRTGGGGSLVQFQTARVAGRRKGSTEGVPPARVIPAPWNRLAYPPPPAPPGERASATAATDLSALVESIVAAAAKLDIPEPRRPWLPPLPSTVVLDQLPASTGTEDAVVPVPFGLEDHPALQAQGPATFDVAGGGHLLVIGAARSGRSTVLRTLAAALARSVSPSDVHLYGLDFGNGALLPLAALPHCGAVVQRSETDRVERLVARLTDEVARRQALLAKAGYGDVAEQRDAARPGERLPYLVVLLDRWEGFTAQFPPDTASQVPASLTRLVREGLGAGVRFVIAGDRSLLSDRLSTLVDDKLVLRLADRNDYRMVNLSPKAIPDEMAPGRALRADSGSELQIALVTEDPSGQAQGEALRRLGEEAAGRWPVEGRANRPFKVDVLPTSVTLTEVAPLAAGARAADAPLWAFVGVGGDELNGFGVDLGAEGGGFVIAGPAKTGRSTALLGMAQSLLAGGASLLVICPRPSPLQGLVGQEGVVGVFSGRPTPDAVAEVLGKASAPLAVLVDDAEAFARSEADEALREWFRNAAHGQAALVVAGSLEELKTEMRGVIAEAKKAKAGLLLSPPSTLDGDVVGVRLTKNLVGRTPPGRGLLARHGEVEVIQVPLPEA